MPETTPVSAYLLEPEIPHRVFRHPGPIYSLEQAARERGLAPVRTFTPPSGRESVKEDRERHGILVYAKKP